MTHEQIEREIEELYLLPYDWDQEGAEPISPVAISTIRRAWAIIKEKDPFREWHLAPMSAGRCQLETCSAVPALEIEAGTTGLIHYLKWTGVDETTSEGLCSVAEVPTLLEWLRSQMDA